MIKLSSIKIILVSIVLLILFLLPIYRNLNDLSYYFLLSHSLYYIAFSFTILLPLIFYYFKLTKKDNALLLILTNIFCLYSFELFLEYSTIKKNTVPSALKEAESLANDLGVKFDNREKFQFLDSLNKLNNNTFSNISGANLFRDKNYRNGIETVNGDTIFPLGGISYSYTTLDKENGYYPIVYLDGNGFRNDVKTRDLKDVDFVLIGDSYAESYSVNNKNTMANTFISEGYSTICLAKAGYGPLSKLATLVEYGGRYKPKNVIWFYCFNDLSDLKLELNSKILKKYIYEKNYKQNLYSKQSQIDKMLKEYEFSEKQKYDNKNKKEIISNNSILRIIRLFNVRSRLIIKKDESEKIKSVKPNYDIFKGIIKKANQIIKEWNGKLILVQVPDYHNYTELSKGFEIERIETILKSIKSSDIEIIDGNNIFDKHNNPLKLWPFGQFLHLNEMGYQYLSLQIIKILKNRKVIN